MFTQNIVAPLIITKPGNNPIVLQQVNEQTNRGVTILYNTTEQ